MWLEGLEVTGAIRTEEAGNDEDLIVQLRLATAAHVSGPKGAAAPPAH